MNAERNFERRRLKFVASINDETLTDETDPDFEIQYVDIGNVDLNGEIKEIVEYKFSAAPSRARRIARDGDVIISTVRTYLQAIAPIHNPPENLIVSTGFAVVRPTFGVLDAGFCKYALRHLPFIHEVMARSVGVSYPAVNASDVADIQIPLPPLEQQQQIADYLDRETAQIDALILEKETMLGLLEQKRAALVSRAVTRGLNPRVELKDSGLEWLGEIPAHWEVKRLKFLVNTIEQGWSPQCHNTPADPGTWGVLKTGCVNGGVFREEENKSLPIEFDPPLDIEVQKGDILMSRASGSLHLIGSVAEVEEQPLARLLLSDKTYRFRLNHLNIKGSYLVKLMNSSVGRFQIRAVISGAEGLANNIAKTDIFEMVFPLPDISEQKNINTVIDKKLKEDGLLKKKLLDSISLLRERRSALITAAVTGQLALEEMHA